MTGFKSVVVFCSVSVALLSTQPARAADAVRYRVKCAPIAVDPIEYIGAQGVATFEGVVTFVNSTPEDDGAPVVKADADVALTEKPNDVDPSGVVFKGHIQMDGYYSKAFNREKFVLNYNKEEVEGNITRTIQLSFDLVLGGDEPSDFEYSIAPFYGKCSGERLH